MGPPPKYLIQRKLVRSVAKKVVPKNPLIPTEYFSSLLNCWKTHGISSNKCMDEELKFDFAQIQTLEFKNKLKKMRIKQVVSSELKRPIYPFEVKGRHTAYRFNNFALIKLHESFF